jgi:hypothetical protein
MTRLRFPHRPTQTRSIAALLSAGLLVLALSLPSHAAPPFEREVIDGITTTRIVQGEPYDLTGNRVVFTNWYYVQPGDLDWRNAEGESVYVHGDVDMFGAFHVGVNPPHGIRLMAEKPTIVGPFDRPYRSILQDGGIYKGWTSTEYCESTDGMMWETKAQLVLDVRHEDGIHHVFIDPVAPPEERFKAVWVGHITRAAFDAFREKRPDGWVKVQVNGVTGRALDDCTPIIGDQHWTQVTWHGATDLGIDEGKPVTLRFELCQAKLFGLEFE